MLNKFSIFLTDKLIIKKIISESEKDLYIYGYQISLSTLSVLISILSLSLVLNIKYGFLFLLFFFPIRLFTGGYHACSYFRCFICTNTFFLLTTLIAILLLRLPITIIYFIGCISLLYIWKSEPILHPNNPLTIEEVESNKKYARIIIFLEFFLLTFGLYFGYFTLISMGTTTTIVVSILISLPKNKQKKARNQL